MNFYEISSTVSRATMSGTEARVYSFGNFRVETGRRKLSQNGEPAPLTPKVFDTLVHLVTHHGQLVEKDDLMRAVWPSTVVEENNLTQNIAALRRVLHDPHGENRYIVTIPGRGYQFVADVKVFDEPSATPLAQTMLAVLPFENFSGDPGREYLADGLTEETIAALGQVDPARLGVIGRTAVLPYKHSTGTIADIGRELRVTYLVEGSLRAESGRLRITARLVCVQGQVQVWSASFDSEPRSMLEFQRELAGVIAQQVRLQLAPERLAAMSSRQTQNAQAYDLYLRGRHFWHRLTPATTRDALEHYRRATVLDPTYALAWSGIADAYSAGPITGDAEPRKVWPIAREAAGEAVRAQPDLAEAQTSYGFLKFWLDWDWPDAERAFRRAIELDRNYALPHRMLGLLYSHLGRPQEALPAMRRARELDPLLAVHHGLSAQVAFAARDYALAAQFARQALVVDPDFRVGHFQLAQTSVGLGAYDFAERALDDASRNSGGNSKVAALRGYMNARLGRRSDAEQALRALIELRRERYVPPCAIALVYAGLRQFDEAAVWLERACEARDVHLVFLPIDPKWDEFRADSRFKKVLKQCAFASAI
jgi:DNA-binding winged helix-turn-helix (wHTH) protein/tetratricopeptide (TPR) repeat protein